MKKGDRIFVFGSKGIPEQYGVYLGKKKIKGKVGYKVYLNKSMKEDLVSRSLVVDLSRVSNPMNMEAGQFYVRPSHVKDASKNKSTLLAEMTGHEVVYNRKKARKDKPHGYIVKINGKWKELGKSITEAQAVVADVMGLKKAAKKTVSTVEEKPKKKKGGIAPLSEETKAVREGFEQYVKDLRKDIESGKVSYSDGKDALKSIAKMMGDKKKHLTKTIIHKAEIQIKQGDKVYKAKKVKKTREKKFQADFYEAKSVQSQREKLAEKEAKKLKKATEEAKAFVAAEKKRMKKIREAAEQERKKAEAAAKKAAEDKKKAEAAAKKAEAAEKETEKEASEAAELQALAAILAQTISTTEMK